MSRTVFVVAYLWAILVIVNSFLIIDIAPWFAAAMITLAILVPREPCAAGAANRTRRVEPGS